MDCIELVAASYSELGRVSFPDVGGDDTSIDGIMVSAMAMRVFHCDGVSTSPAGAGGSGLAKGAMKPACWVDMIKVSCN